MYSSSSLALSSVSFSAVVSLSSSYNRLSSGPSIAFEMPHFKNDFVTISGGIESHASFTQAMTTIVSGFIKLPPLVSVADLLDSGHPFNPFLPQAVFEWLV